MDKYKIILELSFGQRVAEEEVDRTHISSRPTIGTVFFEVTLT